MVTPLMNGSTDILCLQWVSDVGVIVHRVKIIEKLFKFLCLVDLVKPSRQKTDLDRSRQKISDGFYEGLCFFADFLLKTTKPFVKQHLRHRLKRIFEKFIIEFTNFLFFL